MVAVSGMQKMNLFGLNLGNASVRSALGAYANGERLSAKHLSSLVCGSNLTTRAIDLRTGTDIGSVPITDLDLAATKPVFVPVLETAMHLQASFRHNTGRSNGVKPEVMTQALEDSREIIGKFFDIDPARHVVIFRERTSIGMPGLIKIAARDKNHMFLLSLASHHSAQLPARVEGRYQFFGLNPNGTYNMDDLEERLKAVSTYYHPYVVIESETNMTGYKPPVEEVCKLAAKYGAKVFIDHAQGAANHRLSLKDLPGDVFLAISGHKCYAIEGSGAVIGPTDFFKGVPEFATGGTISAVTREQMFFDRPPINQEHGTQVYIAQISLGKALSLLMDAGMDNIEAIERHKTAGLIEGLGQVEGLEIIGEPDMDVADRGPVVTISMRGAENVWSEMPNCYIPPAFIGKALNVGWGIGTRVGYYCAHPYGYFLRGVPDDVALEHAMAHAAKGRAGCGLLAGDEWIYMTRFSFSFVTPDRALNKLPGILSQIRELSYKNSVIQPDFESGVWYIKDGNNDSRANAHARFDLSARGPYAGWVRDVLESQQ